jgi:hypothetical protein
LKSNEFCVWAVSDPISQAQAEETPRRSIPDFDQQGRRVRSNCSQAPNGQNFDVQRITGGWNEKLKAALAPGRGGMRVSGNAFWMGTKHWKEFCDYEHELDLSLAGQNMIVLCTYSLHATSTSTR